jgi:hypothetical protein
MDRNSGIWTVWPMLPATRVPEIRLGFVKAWFINGQVERPAVAFKPEWEIAPGRASERQSLGMSFDDFAAQQIGTAKSCAQECGPTGRRFASVTVPDLEMDMIPNEPQSAAAGGGGHDWNQRLH